jgi:hypothetical protein
MGAGDGAAEQSRLAAERVARLKRQLDQAERATKPWDVGAPCERVVADKLSELIPHGWYVLHDVHWPGRPKANLDHVLVGPGGVVVVDAKNWTGEVRISSGVLWQGRYSRTLAVEGALAQCAAVASVLEPPLRRFARPMICMSAQPDLFGITSSDVAVAGTDRVVDAILALPQALDQDSVVGLYVRLGEQLTQEQGEGLSLLRPADKSPADRSPAGGAPRVGGRGAAAGVGGPGVGGPARRVPVPGAREAGSRAATSPAATSPEAARQGPASVRPGLREAAPGLRKAAPGPRAVAAGTGGSGIREASPGRRFRSQEHAGTGTGRLFFLAAFVTFAVYVLPYWGR